MYQLTAEDVAELNRRNASLIEGYCDGCGNKLNWSVPDDEGANFCEACDDTDWDED